jgi:hypothetical protein
VEKLVEKPRNLSCVRRKKSLFQAFAQVVMLHASFNTRFVVVIPVKAASLRCFAGESANLPVSA